MSATSIASPLWPARAVKRLDTAIRSRPALALAAATLLLAWPALIASHSKPAPLPVARKLAIRDVQADPSTAQILKSLHWTRYVVSDIDRRYEAVWLFDGNKLVLTAVVNVSGSVPYKAIPARSKFAYGSNIANDWRLLGLMSALFVLMTAVWPIWRLRNLDVAVATSTVAGVVLLNEGTIARMVLAIYPALLYLAARCGWRALGPARPSAPSVSLYEHLTRRWADSQRVNLLRLLGIACAAIVAMVGLSSLGVVDVGYAVMEGATAILHGLLPYGHVADILHGDTYPIGTYLFYVPFAWLSPVHDQWNSADITLAIDVAVALLAAWGISRAGPRIRTRSSRPAAEPRDLSGLRGAIAWLTFPPLLVTVSTGTSDIVLAGVLLAALLLWRRPAASTSLLTIGAWFKLVPVALLPLWLASQRGRKLVRAVACVAAISAAMLAMLLALGGAAAIPRMGHALSYQATRDTLDSIWSILGTVPLQQLAQAATLALIVGGALRIRRDPALREDRTRVAALGGAVLLGLQISSSYWTYMYLVWVLPFLAFSVLGFDGSSQAGEARPPGR